MFVGEKVNLFRRIHRFKRDVVGRYIRGQLVQDVGFEVDTIGLDLRYFVRVYFAENPPTDESPEMNALQRIFSEIPAYAFAACDTLDHALAVMEDPLDRTWVLQDENPPKVDDSVGT